MASFGTAGASAANQNPNKSVEVRARAPAAALPGEKRKQSPGFDLTEWCFRCLLQVTPAPGDSVSSLSFSPKANHLVSTSWDNQVRSPPLSEACLYMRKYTYYFCSKMRLASLVLGLGRRFCAGRSWLVGRAKRRPPFRTINRYCDCLSTFFPPEVIRLSICSY